MTKAKKQAIQRKLIRELKHNPRLIKNRRWLRAAGHVDAFLPLTVRLNPIVLTGPPGSPEREAASDDTASLDLTGTFGPSIGPKATSIQGKVEVTAHFGNPAEGDALGDLRLQVDSADLWASSVGVLESPGSGALCASLGPGTTRPDSSYQHASLNPGVTTGFAGLALGSTVAASSLAPSVVADTTVRTAPIHLTLANIVGSPNIGKANLFATSNNVRLSLHTFAAVNTIFRSMETGAPFAPGSIPSALFICDEAYAAQTNSSSLGVTDVGTVGHRNVIPVNVGGSLTITPAITTDGKLRLAKVTVASPTPEHSTVDACLQVHSLVPSAKAQSDETTAPPGGLGLPAGTIVGGANGPTTACDAAYGFPAFPLAIPFPPPGPNPPLVDEITPPGAKFLSLEPDVQVTNLTAEALVGQGPDY